MRQPHTGCPQVETIRFSWFGRMVPSGNRARRNKRKVASRGGLYTRGSRFAWVSAVPVSRSETVLVHSQQNPIRAAGNKIDSHRRDGRRGILLQRRTELRTKMDANEESYVRLLIGEAVMRAQDRLEARGGDIK